MSYENNVEQSINMNIESELLQLRSLAHALQYQVEVLQSSENELKQKLTGVLRELEHNRHELEDLRFKSGSSDVEIGLYKAEIATLRSSVVDLEREAKHWRHEVDEVANEQSHTEQSLRTEVEKLRNRLSSGGRKSLGSMDEENDHDEEEDMDLLDVYRHGGDEDDMKSIRSNNNTIDGLETVVTQLTSSVSALEEENQALRDHLEALQTEHEESHASNEGKKDIFQEEALALRRELQQCKLEREREVSALVDENQRLFKEKHDLDEQVEHFKKIASSNNNNSSSSNGGRLERKGSSSSSSSSLLVRSPTNKANNTTDTSSRHIELVHQYESLRAIHSQVLGRLQAAKGNILVAVRTRPPSKEEVRMGGKMVIDGSSNHSRCNEGELMVHDWKSDSWRSFHFDFVWPQEAMQEEVFVDVEPLVVSVADGFNGCILAYGVTGSGKTFTMEGPEPDDSNEDSDNEEDMTEESGNFGLFQRSVAVLLDQLELKQQIKRRQRLAGNNPSATITAMVRGNKKKRRASGFDDKSSLSALQPTSFSSSTLESQFRSSPNSSMEKMSMDQPSSLSKAPSFFEVSNPLSRRRSTLHVTPVVTKSQEEREAEEEAYGFTAEGEDGDMLTVGDEGLGDEEEDSDRLQLSMSMMEIYNEQCFDLLSSPMGSSGGGSVSSMGNSSISLDMKQDPSNNGLVTIPGLSSVSVSSLSEAMEVYAKGRDYRSSSSNSSRSSRSHLIVMLEVRSGSSSGSDNTSDSDCTATVMSRLYLVDLAGSEKSDKAATNISKWSTSAQKEKEAVRETQHVNQSLSALADVMEALDKKAAVIPYRNSKLTFLLQNVLSASSASRCLLVATLSPTDLSYEESLSTLSFAAKVRNISLGPAVRNNSSALRNLEQALRTARNEAKELRKQKAGLEEALSISRKGGKDGANRIGDKFAEAKVQQLEEAKRAADLFIQQLSRQLHEANSKLVEEKRQRETMALDAELMQRNLKKALQQLHLHEASAALLRVSDDEASVASSSKNNNKPEETNDAASSASSHRHHSPHHDRHHPVHSSPSHSLAHAPHSYSHSQSSNGHSSPSHGHVVSPNGSDPYHATGPDRRPSPVHSVQSARSTHSTHSNHSNSSSQSSPSHKGVVVSNINKPYTVIAAKSHLPPSAFPPNPNKITTSKVSPKVSPASNKNGGFRPGREPPKKTGGSIDIAAVKAAEAANTNKGSRDSYDTPPKQFVPFQSGHSPSDDDHNSIASHSILLQQDDHRHNTPSASRVSKLPRSSSKPPQPLSRPQPQLVISPSSTVTKKVRPGAGYHPWDDNNSIGGKQRLPAAATTITPATAAYSSHSSSSTSTVRRASTGSGSRSGSTAAVTRKPSTLSPNNNDDERSVISAQPSVGSGNMSSAFVRQLPGQKRRSSLEPSPYSQQAIKKTAAVKASSSVRTTSRSAPAPTVSTIAEELIVPYEEEGPELELEPADYTSNNNRAVMGRRLPIPARHSRGDSFQIPSLTTQPGLSDRAKASMDAHRARIEKKREEKSRTQVLKEKVKGRAYGMPSPSPSSSPSKYSQQEQF